jgi:hypothetical protein
MEFDPVVIGQVVTQHASHGQCANEIAGPNGHLFIVANAINRS